MATLKVTLIDVGWGDSIFLEHEAADKKMHYALIDSNDSTGNLTSFQFIRRHFMRFDQNALKSAQLFRFVMLTHDHADHGDGLKKIMQAWGTEHFWYSKSGNAGVLGVLMNFANTSKNVGNHQAVDTGKALPDFGDVKMKILWPDDGAIDNKNENNNSIVLLLTFGKTHLVLSGDAEGEVWEKIAGRIPSDGVHYFKVPHHGSKNGSFFNKKPAKWFAHVPRITPLGLSCNRRSSSQDFPSKEVIDEFDDQKRPYYRTDLQYHIIAISDGNKVEVQYSHV